MLNITKPKIYSYVRFSRDIQLKGDSLTRQRDSISNYSQKMGYELDESLRFEDKGLSGYSRENLREGGKLYAFLEEIKKGNVPKGSILLIEALDRLSRAEPTKFFKVFTDILDAGVMIVTTKDGGEYTKENVNNDISKLLTSIIYMVQANSESKEKSRRIRNAWVTKRKEIGKKFYSSRCPSWIKPIPSENRFELIPGKFETVQRMFKMVLDGDHCDGISRKFIEENVPIVGKRKLWSSSYVRISLRNLSVTGKFQTHKMENGKRIPDGEVIPDYYPRIVSDEDYARVNAIMDSRQKNGKSGRITDQNIFRGILFCGYCGAPAYRNRKGSDKYRKNGSTFYVCSRAKEGNGCLYYAWNAKEFENDFLSHAQELQVGMSSGNEVREKIAQRDVIVLDLKETEKGIENITNAIEQGLISPSLKTRLRSLEDRKESLRIEYDKKDREIIRLQSPVSTVEELQAFLRNLEQPENRKKAANVISSAYDKIFLFFGGSRYTFANITRDWKQLAKEHPDNLGKVSAMIRDKYDRKKNRFFVARINGLGINGRTCFPRNAFTPDQLNEIEPDDSEMEIITP